MLKLLSQQGQTKFLGFFTSQPSIKKGIECEIMAFLGKGNLFSSSNKFQTHLNRKDHVSVL